MMTDCAEILNLLRGLNEKVDGLNIRVGGLDTKVDGLSSGVDGLDTKVHGLDTGIGEIDQERGRALDMLQQDTAMIRSVVSSHSNTLHILRQDMRLMRAAVNDMAKESVTPGEVAVSARGFKPDAAASLRIKRPRGDS